MPLMGSPSCIRAILVRTRTLNMSESAPEVVALILSGPISSTYSGKGGSMREAMENVCHQFTKKQGILYTMNYIQNTFRTLRKNKAYSILNIFGLAIGLACAGMIFLWVEDELSFDSNN